jgi:hypothetical protein
MSSDLSGKRRVPIITLENYRAEPMYPRVERAVLAILVARTVVTPVDVLVHIGLLQVKDLEFWRRGRIPFLERVINVPAPPAASARTIFGAAPRTTSNQVPREFRVSSTNRVDLANGRVRAMASHTLGSPGRTAPPPLEVVRRCTLRRSSARICVLSRLSSASIRRSSAKFLCRRAASSTSVPRARFFW